ncbi:MAG: porphobilinogen synthase, partial [Pseudacidovorax sp.]|nr:porphobilinogen synthase [Pseudacidovorax sp.]
MTFHAPYPAGRPRRLRRDGFSRNLVRENVLTAHDFIYPVFVHEQTGRAPVPSMPGVERVSIDELLRLGEEALELGVPVLDLFGVPDPTAKTADGAIAWDENGIIPRAIRALKSRFPELGVMTDQALDPYTTHGQDGLIDESGYILNDATIEALVRQSLVHAAAGV